MRGVGKTPELTYRGSCISRCEFFCNKLNKNNDLNEIKYASKFVWIKHGMKYNCDSD